MRYALAFSILLFVGCTSLGLTVPKTFQQRIAYGNASLTAIYDGIASCVTSTACSKETGRGLVAQADTARAALDVAGAAGAPDAVTTCFGQTKTALGCLQAAQLVVDGLAAYLRARQ